MQPEQGHRLAGASSSRHRAAVRPAAAAAAGQAARHRRPPSRPRQPAGPAPPPSADPAPAGPQRPAGRDGPPSRARRCSDAPATKMFRLPGAVVAWWAWVIFAVACLADIAFTGRNHTGRRDRGRPLVFITGLVYACALRPRVIADSAGDHRAEPAPRSPDPLGLGDRRGPEGVGPGALRAGAGRQAREDHPQLGAVRPAAAAGSGPSCSRQGDRRRLPRSSSTTYGAAVRRGAEDARSRPRPRSWPRSWTSWPGRRASAAPRRARGWSAGPGSRPWRSSRRAVAAWCSSSSCSAPL